MKTKAISKTLAVILAAVIMMACLPVGTVYGADDSGMAQLSISGTKNYTMAQEVLELVNQQRANLGIQTLKMDSFFMDCAMFRGAEIAVFFDHARPDGTRWSTILGNGSFTSRGENIAMGDTTAQGVFDSWMNSAGHRANIEDPSYNSIGIGCVVQNGITYWVQIFHSNVIDSSDTRTGTEPDSYTFNVLPENVVLYLNVTVPQNVKIGDSISITEFGIKNKKWTSFRAALDPDSVEFSSSDEKVVFVTGGLNNQLQVTGAGTATITMCLKGAPEVFATCEITIGKLVPEVTLSVHAGDSIQYGHAMSIQVFVRGSSYEEYQPTGTLTVKEGDTVIAENIDLTVYPGDVEAYALVLFNPSAGTHIYTVEYNGDANYNAVNAATEEVTVKKATLIVTAQNEEMDQGEEMPEFTYTCSGFVNGEDESVLEEAPVVSLGSETETPGEYSIIVSGGKADNYQFEYVSGILTVHTAEEGLLGDVDLNGEVSIKDVTLLQKYLASMESLDEQQFANAKVMKDGSVSIVNATAIQKYLANVITEFEAETP